MSLKKNTQRFYGDSVFPVRRDATRTGTENMAETDSMMCRYMRTIASGKFSLVSLADPEIQIDF